MLRITLIIISALLFMVAPVSAATIHILWITAKNETGNADLGLVQAMNPNLLEHGQDYLREINWLPIPGVTVKEYTFGKKIKSRWARDQADCSLEKNAIRRFIRNLDVGYDDAVVIYYRGHGVYDEKAKGIKKFEAQHSYQFASDNCSTPDDPNTYDYLLHRDLRLDVEAKNPRLAVFIRDCCGLWGKVPTRGVRPGGDVPVDSPGDEPRFRDMRQELFISLFVKSRGVVDIAATQAGFAALSQPIPEWREGQQITEEYYTYGTVFSNSFAEVFDTNRTRALTWEAFFGALKPNCERRYIRAKPTAGLTPEEVKLVGTHTPRAAPLGGIYALKDFDNRLAKSTIPENYFEIEGEPVYGGVLLTRIAPDSRGFHYGLEQGDIIYAVDDVLVTTNKELELACRILGDDGKLKFTIVNSRDGSTVDVEYPDIRAEIVK